eukprot:CAMPEP_0174926720 /NCGR_PEP_ID=MMETSP1355-20121228/13965_1 /TAXON_ID=464990 /ORGANISM="Hemiselmis tepida, Strain CCMP443" /LENGTH=333 /DNA_ID=CAMNT_0016172777 /DNA_START=46 /DNA_END=1044 /DNA_ORIENTATION=+
MAWDDDEDDWEKEEDVQVPVKKKSEWSDEEEEEEDEEDEVRFAKLRKEKAELEKRLSEIVDELPFEKPKESAKKGKQMKKLLNQKDEEERSAREEAMRAEKQVSQKQKIEEADFENAQDMFGGGSAAAAGGADSGKFESWRLDGTTKQAEYEAFAQYAADKIKTFSGEFLYIALLRKLLGETTKSLDAAQAKELLLVLTKRDDFTVLDLVRSLFRDADRDITTDDITSLLLKVKVAASKPKPGQKAKEPEVKSSRVELLKLVMQDFVRDMKPEDMGKVVEEGCGITLTRDQTSKIATRRAEMAGDPAAQKNSKTQVRGGGDHKAGMFDAYGTG